MKTLDFYFKDSIKNHYCLGAYNFVNMEVLKGICMGSAKTNSPCLTSVSEGAFQYMGEEFVLNLFKSAKNEFNIPIFLHLDHGKSFEMCKRAVDLGFDSVMIDGSSLPFEENVALTKKVVSYAHKKGVFVEAELGVLKGVEDLVSADKNIYTKKEEAKKFVEETCCDTLAVAIGTSHGAYKFKGEAKLRFDILSGIESELKNYPLVLHGASSVPQKYVEIINSHGGKLDGARGVDDTLLHEACTKHNIFKINTDTDLRLAYFSALRTNLDEYPENIDIRKFNSLAMEEIANYVAHKNEHVFNCANKV